MIEESQSVPPNTEKIFILDLNLVIEEEGRSSWVKPEMIATAAQKRGFKVFWVFLLKMMMPKSHFFKRETKIGEEQVHLAGAQTTLTKLQQTKTRFKICHLKAGLLSTNENFKHSYIL